MADPYGLELSGLTPELSAEASALARRQKVAEAMALQAQQPLATNRMAGRSVVPISPFEGMAQLLRGYSSGKELAGIDTQRADIAKRGREAVSAEMARIQGIGEDKPGQVFQPATPNDDEGNPIPSAQGPAIPGDKQRMVAEAMLSPLPQANRFGAVMQGSLDKREIQKNLLEQRQWETTEKAKDRMAQIVESAAQGRITREEADRRSAELRKEMQVSQQAHERAMKQLGASLAAGLRQPPAPQIIQTENGPVAVGRDNVARPIMTADGQLVKAPAKVSKGLSATGQKELIQTEEEISGAKAGQELLKQAITLNNSAMGGLGSSTIANVGSILPDAMRPQTVDNTIELENLVQNSVLPQMKGIFGGNPTNSERQVLFDVSGSVGKPAKVREGIFKRANDALEARLKSNADKAARLRAGTYFTDEGAPASPAAPATPALPPGFKPL